jgi:hypothetical protein
MAPLLGLDLKNQVGPNKSARSSDVRTVLICGGNQKAMPNDSSQSQYLD